MRRFYSHGKLLLTAEYLVLRGAKALALPTTFGQSLEIESEESYGHSYVNWFAYSPDKLWFKTSLELPSLDVIATDDRLKSAKLQLILLTLQQLNPKLFTGQTNYKVITRLDFEPEWGLGTSSTLIANLASWARIDPYTLLRYSIGGSGYDIACAKARSPVFYELKQFRPVVTQSDFQPPFADKLFFVYSGKKQDSAQEIRYFNELTEDHELTELIAEISAITDAAAITTDYQEFCRLMDQHEQLLAGLLLQPPVKSRFPDFPGHLKSLGAWGGDFMLAMSQEGEQGVRDYFNGKGLHTLFPYHAIVRQKTNSPR